MTTGTDWLPASFRGVPFVVKSHRRRSGRRGPTHTYPGRDDGAFEDLGLVTARFSIEGWVIGADHAEQASRLRAALDSEGAGDLNHPRHGRVSVSVPEYEESEDISELLMTRFSITCVRSGDVVYPAVQADTQAVLATKATAAREASVSQFAEDFSVAQQPDFVADDAQQRITSIMAKASQAMNDPQSLLPADEIADLLGDAAELARTAFGYVSVGLTLYQSAQSVSNASFSWTAVWQRGLQVALGLVGLGDAYPLVTQFVTPARERQRMNAGAIANLFDQAAVISAAGKLAEIDFQGSSQAPASDVTWSNPDGAAAPNLKPSRGEILQLKDDFTTAFDRILPNAGDTSFRALTDLRAAVYADLATRAEVAQDLVPYDNSVPLPALVLAHRLYGDAPDGGASREVEILARNPSIRHPGHVPPGKVEVTADA